MSSNKGQETRFEWSAALSVHSRTMIHPGVVPRSMSKVFEMTGRNTSVIDEVEELEFAIA